VWLVLVCQPGAETRLSTLRCAQHGVLRASVASGHCNTSSDTSLPALRTQQEYDRLTELHLTKGRTTCGYVVTGLVLPDYGCVGTGTPFKNTSSSGPSPLTW
jgi:hypothetical protein